MRRGSLHLITDIDKIVEIIKRRDDSDTCSHLSKLKYTGRTHSRAFDEEKYLDDKDRINSINAEVKNELDRIYTEKA